MDRSEQTILIKQLKKSIEGTEAHIDLESALHSFPSHLRGTRPPGGPHSAWELVEHMRIALHDILEFSRDARHKSPVWPDEYWPKSQSPKTDADWDRAVKALLVNRQEFESLLDERADQLLEPLPYGAGQTLLREALLIASHNSYHLGQLMHLQRSLSGQ